MKEKESYNEMNPPGEGNVGVMNGLLTGSDGILFASWSIITILILMFLVSARLYHRRRKRAYLTFTVSILIVIAQYALTIALATGTPVDPVWGGYVRQMLQVAAFLMIHLGMYQLYNRSRRRDYTVFLAFLALGAVLALLFAPSERVFTLRIEEQMLHFVGLDVYLLMLIFLGAYLLTPRIGQTVKFLAGLFVYFLAHLAHIINDYVYHGSHSWYAVGEHVLPILYFIILFLFLFERVVEILQAVYHSSITDGLTGLYNRSFILKRVDLYAARNLKIGVIFTDIDNFKKLNDTQGHQVGDEKLKLVANILKEEAEDIGIAGRYGGEEMVVLVTDPRVKIGALAEKIRRRVEAETGVTVSVGWAALRSGMDGQTLVKRADEAMYVSKTTGKNKVTGDRDRKVPWHALTVTDDVGDRRAP
jgi:diguanylate cyclase (GGDEF)-like protein